MFAVALLSTFTTAHAARPEAVFTGVDLGLTTLVGEHAFPMKDHPKRPKPAVDWNGASVAATAAEWTERMRDRAQDLVADRMRANTSSQTTNVRAIQDVDWAPPMLSDADSSQPLLTRADIVLRVAGYPKAPIGMAYTLIGDQLNGNDTQGCFWMTFYDAGTGVVHTTEYSCHAPGGRKDGLDAYVASAERVLNRLPEQPLPDRRVAMALTSTEIADAIARDPSAEAVFASMEAQAGQVAQQAIAEAREAQARRERELQRQHERELAETLATRTVVIEHED